SGAVNESSKKTAVCPLASSVSSRPDGPHSGGLSITVCHSKSGEINPVKVGNLVKAYVDKYKHARKHRKAGDLGKASELRTEALKMSDSP
uniref:SFR19-like C-terminal domain-containing protein n=1 Tax=Echeneis naucrates TaxID=173247 RepID=A0A665UQF1_ECHNA